MASWWMMQYGAPTPKRLQARSNWCHVRNLQTGRLAAQYMRDNTKFKTASVVLSLTEQCYISSYCAFRKERKDMEWNQEPQDNPVPRLILACMHVNTLSLNGSRAYPPAFGRKLFEIWSAAPEEPTSTLRTVFVSYTACMSRYE